MIKRILPLLLVLLCLSPLTVSADFLPEENPVGETLTVEPDSNIIKENLDKEKEDETRPIETDEIIEVTPRTYLNRFFKPFLILFAAGIGGFLILELIAIIRGLIQNKKQNETI